MQTSKNKEKKMTDYCEDCGQVMWLCICEKEVTA